MLAAAYSLCSLAALTRPPLVGHRSMATPPKRHNETNRVWLHCHWSVLPQSRSWFRPLVGGLRLPLDCLAKGEEVFYK